MKTIPPPLSKAGLQGRRTLPWAMLLAMSYVPLSQSVRAADTWTLPNGNVSAATWQSAVWSKNGAPASGAYPGVPGGLADDQIVTNATSDGTIGVLYSNGSHTFGDLEKRGTGTFTIRAHISASNNANVADSLTLGGALSVQGGTLSLRSRKTTQTLSVSAEALNLSAGSTLVFGDQDAGIAGASFSTSTLDAGSTLRIVQSGSTSLGTLTNNGTVNLSDYESASPASSTVTATSLQGGGLVTSSGGNQTLTFSLTGGHALPVTFSGSIEDTSTATNTRVGILKSGTGVQIFSGNSTYSGGTVISGGVLAVTGSGGKGLGTGAVRVASGGTLAGSGMLENSTSITAQSGAVIAPGAGLGQSAVTLTLSGAETGAAPVLVMESGAAFEFNLASGGVSDRIDFLSYSEGDLVLDSLTGTAVHVTGAQLGNTYELFTFSSLSSSEGNDLINNLRLGSGFSGLEQSHFFYLDDAIHLAVIPEPSLLALTGLGIACVAGWRRRKSL